MQQAHATTILCVHKDGQVALGGDGQVSLGETVMKGNARKVRRLHNDRILAGFAGGTADAFTLFERFETNLEGISGQLLRSAVELAKDWRSDRYLRRLEAMLIVADASDGTAHQRQRRRHRADGIRRHRHRQRGATPRLPPGPWPRQARWAPDIVERALAIAADICIYTNHNRTIEVLESS